MAIVAVTLMPTLTRLASVGFDGIDICAADHPRSSVPADGDHALSHRERLCVHHCDRYQQCSDSAQ